MGTGGHSPQIAEAEVEFTAIRAGGPGGQNVNKVSTAVRLRFDIRDSSLPDPIKERLLELRDQRISADGVVQIKAQSTRSQEQNKVEALTRLQELVDSVAHVPKTRRPTRPSLSARRQRVDSKTTRGQVKRLRGRVGRDEG